MYYLDTMKLAYKELWKSRCLHKQKCIFVALLSRNCDSVVKCWWKLVIQ
jgi:hypothetical protein